MVFTIRGSQFILVSSTKSRVILSYSEVIHSFNKCLLSTEYLLCAMICVEAQTVKKTGIVLREFIDRQWKRQTVEQAITIETGTMMLR